ncbi:MAG: carboxymuconolactone decarboxylase family protein [Terriglobales bacterium]
MRQEDEQSSEQRLDFAAAAPGALQAMLGLQKYVSECSLDARLLELVKLRCSQINGCAYCVDMHAREARQHGETSQRLDAVAVWRESTLFSTTERAALAWAEAVTQISHDHVPQPVYDWVARYFNGKVLVDLTFAILAINCWNRLAVSFRTPTQPEPKGAKL